MTKRFCGMRCERRFHADLRDDLVNLDEANALAAGGRCAYCAKPFPEQLLAERPPAPTGTGSGPARRAGGPAVFCGAGCARKAKKALEDLSPSERSTLEAELKSEPENQCAWCGRRARHPETLDTLPDPLLDRLTREEQPEARQEVQHRTAAPSRQTHQPNIETLPGRAYTKEEWREIRAGWWGFALLGVLINLFTLGIYSTVLFTLWQSPDDQRSIGKRIAIAFGMTLLLFVPLGWIGVAPWSRDWYYRYQRDRDAEVVRRSEDGGESDEKIATLEAEVEALRRARRAAELRAEISRLQGELAESERSRSA